MYEQVGMEDDCHNITSRYRILRKRLENLGYRQTLPVDALSLVERLLGDLLQTTESLRHFKAIAEDKIELVGPQELTADPYKCDNAKLVQECNKLHADLAEAKENHLKQTKDLKRKINHLETECSDLQLASSRNLKRIKDLEVESSNKSRRIQELLGKCCKPIVSNASLSARRKPTFPLRKPLIEGDVLPQEALKGSVSLGNLSRVKPELVDLVAMGDRKIASLSLEVAKLKGELGLQCDNANTLRTQLVLKGKEINRLRKMLEGGRPYLAVSKDCSCRQAEANCIQCNSSRKSSRGGEACWNEIKVLQQVKGNLEQQLKEALEKQHDAMSQAMKLAERNEELEKELKDIDHIALAVEADCNSTVKENNRRVSHIQEKLESALAKVSHLENDLLVEKRASQELRADLEACRLEKRSLQKILDSTAEEKKKLTDRINELTLIGSKVQRRSLSPPVQEKRNSGSELMRELIQEKDGKIIELQKMVDQLRKETDYCKQEMDRLKKDSRSDNELWSQICDLKHQLNEKEIRVTELQREKRELCREKFELESRLQGCRNRSSPCKVCNQCRSVGPCVCLTLPPRQEIGGSRMLCSRLERERDTARSDVERLIEERDILRERLKMATEAHTYEQRRLRDNGRELESRLKEIERERQELLLAQGSRRTAIAGIEEQLEEAREELRRTKQELVSQRTQYFQLRALQDQTDQALGDVQSQLGQSEGELSKAMERNRSLEQQQLQLDNQVKELKQEINTLRTNMARLDQEKDQLLMELDNKTERIAALEREIISKEQQTMGTEQQVREAQHKYQICMDQSAEQERQLRSMQMEMENNQRQLAVASADRDNAAQENRRLQDDLAALTCEIRTLQRELETSRAESYDLKRQLQTYVSEVRRAEELLNRKENERTEMLNHFRSLSLEATVLENNNQSLESEAAEARGALQSARDRIVDFERELADKDCLIRGYETQITELTQNIASLETQVRQQTEQRARTEADLNAVRDLCVKLDQQKESLMKEMADRNAMKTQYEAQISRLRAEQNIVQEQMNRDHLTVDRMEALLDQARQESLDCQTHNQELQNEMARLKQRVCELQNKLSAESAELRRYQNQAAEYSKQISELRTEVTNERFNRARKEEEHRRHFDEGKSPPGVQPVRFHQSPNSQEMSSRFAQSPVQPNSRAPPVTPESPESHRLPRAPGTMYKDSTPSEVDHAIVQLRGLKNGETSHQTISVPGSGTLCVTTSLHEDDDRKQLKVKVSDVGEGNENAAPPETLGDSPGAERGRERFGEIPEARKQKTKGKKACGCGVDENNLPNCPGSEKSTDFPPEGNYSIKKNEETEKIAKAPDKLEKSIKKKREEVERRELNYQDKILPQGNGEIDLGGHEGELDLVRLLTEVKEHTRDMKHQMEMINSVMKSQSLDETIYPSLPQPKNRQPPVGLLEDVEEGMFHPPRMSTPKKRKIDFNDNIEVKPRDELKEEEGSVMRTSTKKIVFKKTSPSSGGQVRQVKISKTVVDGLSDKGHRSRIPTRLRESASPRAEDNSRDSHESRGTSVRTIIYSGFSSSSSSSQGSPRAGRDPVDIQDPMVFHSLPDHSYNSGSSKSYRDLPSSPKQRRS
ncbi:centrosomal protein of 135 kDa isoform X2 [Fopius arisanus]|uniref:Centrosomal protein of 135 kDa isoform X2 n=1 Tax=Fopius arisanus TaxID=64838 RepID=A0A9R1TUC9_9HYME|nr:PREDICTED: centrosomal protein of 135 kDa isoform X2 [Fopius arisanus]